MQDKYYTKKELGDLGEKLAREFLTKRNYRILVTNYRYSRRGEIDIIARDEKTRDLVFIEVKTRGSTQFGYPEVAVNFHKRQHLSRVIQNYLIKHKIPQKQNYRLDCIAILLNFQTRRAAIRHFECI